MMTNVDWNDMVDMYNNSRPQIRPLSDTGNTIVARSARGRLNVKRRIPSYRSGAVGLNNLASKKKTAKKKKERGLSFDLNGVVSEVVSTFTSAFSNPTFLLCMVVVLGFFIAHDFIGEKGPFYELIADKNDTLSNWMRNNTKKICGVALFAPSVADTPSKYQSAVLLSVLSWVLLLPAISVFEYLIQSVSLHTYFRLRSNSSRIVIFVAVFFAWLLGFFKIG